MQIPFERMLEIKMGGNSPQFGFEQKTFQSTSGFGGGMKDTEGVALGQILDDLLVFRNREIGIPAMGGVDHDLEELLLDLFVDSLDHFGRFGRIGEVLEFDPTEKLHVPGLDRAFGQSTFLEAAGMDLDHLLDYIVKGLAL